MNTYPPPGLVLGLNVVMHLYPPPLARLRCKQLPNLSGLQQQRFVSCPCSMFFVVWLHIFILERRRRIRPSVGLAGWPGGRGRRTRTRNGSQSFYAVVCHFQSHPIGQTSHACHHQGGECDRPTGKGSKPSRTRTEPAAINKCSGHCLAREKTSTNYENHSYQSVKWGN